MPEASFYDDLYPRGLRKIAAIGLIFLTGAIPAVSAWQHEPPPGGLVPFNEPPSKWASRQAASRHSVPIGRTLLAITGGAFGLALYYPRSGFKRYALLCGPLLGFGTVLATTWWLTGRTTVYRFELAFAAILGGLPGAALYALLARRKWQRQQAAEPVWIE